MFDGPGGAAAPGPSELSAPEITVVLPTYNGSRTIAAQLDAVLTQAFEGQWELVVVDNGSTDGTAELVDRYIRELPNMRRVSAPDRHNLSYVRNVGVAAARGESILFVDDDDVVGHGWLQAMANELRRSPLVASSMEYRRLNPTERRRRTFQTDHVETLFDIPVVNGALGCKRWVWEAVGGNDETFGATGEDFDFAMRVRSVTGLTPVLVSAAVYHCRLRAGARQAFRQARLHGASHVKLYRRHAHGTTSWRANTMEALQAWWWIISRAPLAAAGVRREDWSTIAGRRVGRVLGSVRYRTWLL